MRLQFGLLTLIALTACSTPKTNENQSKDLGSADSLTSPSLPENQVDSLIYIGYVWRFEDNNSFYTDLYFADNFDYDIYDEVTKMGDQVIFKDEEVKRTRMNIEKIGQYFNLSGLQQIDIYNRKNQKLTTGRLSHIEFVEDLIENKFVAVFQVNDPNVSDPIFCIGNSRDDLTQIEFSSYEDEKLKSEVLEFLGLGAAHLWGISHYRLNNLTISTISVDTTAYIVETLDSSHKTLYRSRSSEGIHGVTAISKEINGRQILLSECGMPETDMTWTSVLIFNGTEYEPSKDHRVK